MLSDDAEIGRMLKIKKDEVVYRIILINWVNGLFNAICLCQVVQWSRSNKAKKSLK